MQTGVRTRLASLERLASSSPLMRQRLEPTIRALRLQLGGQWLVAKAPRSLIVRIYPAHEDAAAVGKI